MGISPPDKSTIDQRIAHRLKELRTERGWSLDALAKRANVSRATLSRLEKAEVSGTANVLGKLCAAHGLTMSRLMRMAEDDFAPLVRRAVGDGKTRTKPRTSILTSASTPKLRTTYSMFLTHRKTVFASAAI